MSNRFMKEFIDNIINWFKKIFNIKRGKISEVEHGEDFVGEYIVHMKPKTEPIFKEINTITPIDLSFKKYAKNMQISKNFNMSEFAVSKAASDEGHTIVIPEDLKPNIVALVTNLLQPICDATGWSDRINSGYRDQFTNELVKGANGSQHTKGEASDNVFFTKDKNGKIVYIKSIDVLRKVIELELDFDQMIAYPNFVHLSYTTKKPNRKEILYNSSYKGERL